MRKNQQCHLNHAGASIPPTCCYAITKLQSFLSSLPCVMCLSSFLSIHSTTSCSFISLHLSSILSLSFFLFPCRRPIPSLFRNKQQYLKCIPGHLYRSYTHYKSEVLYIFHIGENLLPPLRHNILPFQSFVIRTQSSSCRRR